MADPGRIPGQVVIPTCVQVRLLWQIPGGKPVFNVLHGVVAGGFSATSAIAQAAYANLIASGAWTAYAALLNTGTLLLGIDLKDLRTANMPIVASTGSSVAGTGAGGALPAGTAYVVTERTAQAGRGARGRIYLPGFDRTALQAAGTLSGATQTIIFNFITQVSTSLGGQGIVMCVANPARGLYTGRKGAIHLARPAGVLALTAFQTRQNFMNSQRRRSQVA